MYQKIVYLVLVLFLLSPINLLADKFYYKFEKGEKYRIVSTVDESVYINNRFSYSHLFLNKIAMEVIAVLEGRATIEALFQVSGKMEQSAYELYEEAFSRFTIDSQGNLQVLGNYLYPLSRSIPVFSQQDIKVGFSWTAKGEEIHDLRQPYGIKDPFVIPVNVNYTYNGLKKINNRTLAEFIIQYQFTSRVKLTDPPSGPFYPTSIQGKVQMYYSRNLHGIPEKWVKMMKNSMKKIIANFNTHRMIAEYTETMYLPAAQKHISLIKDNFAKARGIAQWKKTVRARFASIHINSISLQGIDGDLLNVGDSIQFNLVIHKGQMTSAELMAEVVIFQEKEEELLNYTGEEHLPLHDMSIITMEQTAETEGELTYQGRFVAQKSGKFNYGIRIMPYHPEVDDIADLNLVFWG